MLTLCFNVVFRANSYQIWKNKVILTILALFCKSVMQAHQRYLRICQYRSAEKSFHWHLNHLYRKNVTEDNYYFRATFHLNCPSKVKRKVWHLIYMYLIFNCVKVNILSISTFSMFKLICLGNNSQHIDSGTGLFC
jgi:hypothetical protein